MATFAAFLIGVLCPAIAVLPLLLRLRRRLDDADDRLRRLEAESETERGIVAAVPDGVFTWHRESGRETCSRRLAVLLNLAAGTRATFADVLGCFDDEAADALMRAVDDLRGRGAAFEITLALAGADRWVLAAGSRAVHADDGRILADLLWIRDAGEVREPFQGAEAAPASASEISKAAPEAKDGGLGEIFDFVPVALWLRDEDLSVSVANPASAGIPESAPATTLAARARAEKRRLTERVTLAGAHEGRIFDISEAPLGDGRLSLGMALAAAAETTADSESGAHAPAQVLENLSIGVAVFDGDTRLGYFNPAFAALWTLDSDWLATRPPYGEILEHLRAQRRLPEYADFKAFKEEQLGQFSGLNAPVATLMHRPDGATVRALVAPRVGGGLVVTHEDLSERLALERSFRELTAVQRETIDNLHEGIAVFGSDGRLKLSNPAFRALWALDAAAEADGFHVTDFVERMGPFLAPGAADWSERAGRVTARLIGRERSAGRLIRDDGTVLDYANVPLPNGALLISYLDVTDGVKVEMALRQRTEALQEADRLKSEFIANVSFEVRTPLTTIIGFSELLGDENFGALNPRQTEYANGIHESATALMAVVSDILDLAMIEAGMMRLELDAVDIHAMLVSVLGLVRERVRHKGLKLEFDCPTEVGWIIADATRLKQVAFKLLSNAITFTPPRGAIRLSAVREEPDVVIRVTDSGPGIAAADLERVFQPFAQATAGTAAPGVGLGLSLVKQFVELHGGRVHLDSAPKQGLSVSLFLPAVGPATGDADP